MTYSLKRSLSSPKPIQRLDSSKVFSAQCSYLGYSAYNKFLAASTFGKFQDSFLSELHAEILSHAKQEATGVASQPVPGITVHDSDVLVPEPVRPGGLLQRSDTVRSIDQCTTAGS